MSSSSTAKSGGIGFCGLLAILFIALKLTHVEPVASWSWWWVLCPIWIPWAIAVVIVVLMLIFIASNN